MFNFVKPKRHFDLNPSGPSFEHWNHVWMMLFGFVSIVQWWSVLEKLKRLTHTHLNVWNAQREKTSLLVLKIRFDNKMRIPFQHGFVFAHTWQTQIKYRPKKKPFHSVAQPYLIKHWTDWLIESSRMEFDLTLWCAIASKWKKKLQSRFQFTRKTILG